MASKPLTLGRRSLSRISYYCDLQQESGRVIPLGVIAEVTLGPVRGLGLIARTKLLDEELQEIGVMVRERISNPFDLLKVEFQWAWSNTKPGLALPVFAKRHTDSLFFSSPKSGGFSAEPVQIEPKLHTLLSKEYLALLDDTYNKPVFRRVAPQTGTILLQDRLAA